MTPAFSLKAVPADKLAGQVKIFSKDMFEYYLYVEYDREFSNKCKLLAIYQILKDDSMVKLPNDYYKREQGRYMIQILSSKLAVTTGYHRYKLLLLDPTTSITYTLYFAYIVQTNEEDRDYIYMKR